MPKAKPKRKDGEKDRRYEKPTLARKKKNPRYKNVHAPKGKRWCTEHQTYEPLEAFLASDGSPVKAMDRCLRGRQEYRRRYKEEYGDQNKNTKTIRIPNKVHAAFMEACKTRGVSMQRTTKVALDFYLRYACTYPECPKPGANAYRRCADHVLSVNPAEQQLEDGPAPARSRG